MALRPQYSRFPFYGRGFSFPMRIDPNTGGALITEGSDDSVSVTLEQIFERWTIRDEPDHDNRNHLAGAIAHILLTRPGEHDTLPEFGSRVFELIFDPNHPATATLFEVWIETATVRWEKRTFIPVPDGVKWSPTGDGIDRGELPVRLDPVFIRTQVEGNLVAPFVTPQEARAQEYPVGDGPDAAGHDHTSRYRRQRVYRDGDVRWVRPRRQKPLPPRSDDDFYEVGHNDTWLLISWNLYGDIRYWWAIAEMYVQDCAERGEPRTRLDPTVYPDPGTVLRCPSRARLLMEIAR